MTDGNHEVNRLRARAAFQEMVNKLKRYEKTLTWYGDASNYDIAKWGLETPADVDSGQRARQAVEGNRMTKRNREIDLLVAEKIMGWQLLPMPKEAREEVMNPALCRSMFCPPGEKWGIGYRVPDYSTKIADAWLVMERLIQTGAGRSTQWGLKWEASARMWWATDDVFIAVGAHTAPMAICLAGLKAKGVEVPR